MFISGRMHVVKIFNDAWRILMNFDLFIVHVYVLERIVSRNYRITWWIFTKLGRDKVLKTPHICIDVWTKSAQGRIQDRAIIGQWGAPSPKIFFFRPEGNSNKPNA